MEIDYIKIWDAAEELAEREAVQYAKAPYTISERSIGKDGKAISKNRQLSRQAYKDRRREKHILVLMEIAVAEQDAQGRSKKS